MINIKLEKNQNLFFTSDTHYNHKNLCRGLSNWQDKNKTRDFKDLKSMNLAITSTINSVVGQDDILIHLGDWSFGGFESILEFRNKIVCKNIHLVLGNHDHHIENNKDGCQEYFSSVSHYTRLKVKDWIKVEEEFVLSHFPICSWHDMAKGVIHLFGHVHLEKGKKIMEGKAMDVGMDGNDLYPYSLQEVIRLLKNKPVKNVYLREDHHELISQKAVI